MVEREPRRVEELPLEAEIARDAVERIAGDGKVDRGEMHADLVRTARCKADTQERPLRQELLELEVRHRRTRCGGVERVPEAVVPVAADRRVDRPSPGSGLPHDEPEVLARKRAAPHESLQPLVRPVRACDDEQAGGVAVEAVDDARPILLPTRRSRGGQSVSKRAAGVPRRGMDDDARGLVHDEEVLVCERHRELGQGDVGSLSSLLRRLDRDLLPTRKLVALASRPAVHEDGAGLEQPLGRSPRAHLGQAGEVAIETLPGGLGRNDEPVQCFADCGSRSARRSAASRIPTPITMKLSARLNAGQ
jgi:hypothetical protein